MDTKQKKRPAAQSSSTRTAASERTSAGAAGAARKPAQTAAKQRKAAPVSRPKRRPAPDVVYTPPKPFSRNRFLLRLATVVAVVVALTFGISIFFKVKTVTVSGAEKYTAWTVREASGIQEGDNLLTFGEAKACAKIKAALPYVDSVRIGIKLPDTVNIEIVELDVVYSVRAQDDTWWLMTSDGRILEQTDSATAGEYAKILGIQLASPVAGQQAQAAEKTPSVSSETGEAVPVTVKGSEQLSAALSILQYLESNGIIGGIASLDVSNLGKIELWYGQQYQVELGDTTQLSYKISCMKKAIDQMSDYQSGVLDVSFTVWQDQVCYTPFE